MRKFSKFTWLIIALTVLLFGLVSCTNKDGVEDNTGGLGAVDEDVIYSSQVKTIIVLGEDVSEEDVGSVRAAYYKQVGKEIALGSAMASPASHEIIVGKTERDISKKAYRVLSMMSEKNKVGYVIYSDGKSVAIAFDEARFGENVAFVEAVELFITKYMQKSSLKLSEGIVCREIFDPIEKQKQRDEASAERLWALKLSQLTAKLGGNAETAGAIVSELQNISKLFNDDYSIVKWLANLYDPETGGFYYSNSARNNQGYLPDLESTAEALGIVESILTGYGGTLTDYFGEEIAAKFVSFAKNMQDAENGYFYHPQWPRELVDKSQAKRSRDVLNALNILECFGAKPTYDTPNGVKGEGVAAPVSKLVAPLRMSSVSAVSQLADSSNDEIYIPAHLRSKSAFENYLSTLDIREDTVAACEKIYSELSLYNTVDEILEENGETYRLRDVLESFLTRNQNSTTGLWSREKKITYEEVGELANVARIFSGIGKTVPRHEAVFETLKRAAQFSEDVDNISDVTSIWSAISGVLNNLTSCCTAESETMINRSVNAFCFGIRPLIKASGEKLGLFLRDDGSFSTTPEGSAYESDGMMLAVPGMEEGDMNATLLAAKNTWLAMFNSLGLGSVPIFNTSDRMMFQKTLLDMGVIIKNEIIKTKPMDFEGYAIGSTSDIRHNAGSSDSFREVVAGPEEQGNVLRLYSPETAGLDQYFFDVMSEVKSASCFAYEMDICILPDTSTGVFVNLYLYQDIYMIAFDRVGDKIRLLEQSSRSSSSSYTRDLGVRVNVEEWFNLRVEYYHGTAETVRIKIYFNDECIAVTDNFFNSYKYNEVVIPGSEIKSVSLYAMGSKTTDILVDDVIVEKTYQTYSAETSLDININVDNPDKPQKTHDFESAVEGATPSGFEVGGKVSDVVVEMDSDGNKVLAFSNGGGELILPLEKRGSGINSAIIEFDLVVSDDSAVGAKYQINFNEYMYQERTFAAMQIAVVSEGGVKHATLSELITDSKGATDNASDPYQIKLALGVKYRLRFQLFYGECALVVSVNGEIVGISSNVIERCKSFNMGETTIEAKTAGIESTIYVDNLISECVRSSFSEMTAPTIERETHVFDTVEGVEVSGVNPVGGVLSFEGITSGYVKIPVNSRVNVPTMALVGFDVAKTESSSDGVVLSFVDKQGNIIAAFALLQTESTVDIYEYTKNGRYQTPIHSVGDAAFNISIEYSAPNESFNILVNDNYVAASSIIFTPDSGAYDFEYLQISPYGTGGLAIDNAYAEEICGIFKAHSVSMPNTDSTSDTVTFESSSFASMPNILERVFGSPASYFRIREGFIRGAATKVLEVNTGNAGSTMAFIKKTQTLPGSNAAFFETDVMLKYTGSLMQVNFEIQALAGSTYSAYSVSVSADNAGGKITVGGGSESGRKDFTVLTDVKEGEWFKIRIEYRDTPYDFDYDENTDCVARVYINGVMVGEGHTPTTLGAVYDATTVNRIRIRNVSGRYGIFYLDNSILGQFNLNYTAPVPADTDTLTYEPGVITKKTEFTLASKDSTAKIAEMADIAGQIGKVLAFHTAENAEDKLVFVPTLTNNKSNAVTFETDIMIDPETDEAVFYIEPKTAGGNTSFKLMIKATKGGKVTVSLVDAFGAADSNINELAVGNSGEWIHLKVDFMNPRLDYTGDNRHDILCKIYIGNSEAPLATGYLPYRSGSYYEPKNIQQYIITTESQTVADIFFDNTRLWQTELVADEAPEFPGAGDPYINDSSSKEFDNNGWV